MSSGGSIIFVPYASPGELIAAGVVFPILSFGAVVLRFYVRSSRKQNLAVDDWLMVPALLMVIGMGACLIAGVKKHAFGYPTPPPAGETQEDFLKDINPEIQINQQIEFAITILLILAYGFIKISILFFYRRLFVLRKNTMNYLTWVLIGIIILWMITFVFLFIFGCGTHFEAIWGSRQDLIKYCGNGLQREEGLYVSEFITNILLVVIPLPTIWRLHMKWQRKLAVTGILLMAFMALIASIFRLIIVLQVTSSSFTAVFDTISTIFYWGMIEAGLALIACCLPVLKPLVTERGVQSVINSVRSAISLQSLPNGSNGSKGSKGSRPSKTASYAKMEGDVDSELLRGDAIIEMNTSNASHVQQPKQTLEPGKIRVQRDVHITDSMA